MNRPKKRKAVPKNLLGARNGKSTLEYRNKQVVFLQGEAASSIFYIEQGGVKLTVKSKRGKTAVLAILEQGDFFGEGCLVPSTLRMSTATVLRTSIIASIGGSAFTRRVRKDAVLSETFMAYLVARVGRAEEGYADLVLNSSERRLALMLCR